MRDSLKQRGFSWVPEEKVWRKEIPKEEVPDYMREYGERKKLHIFTDEPEWSRGSGYRVKFLRLHGREGTFRCVYCGKKLDTYSLTVDHLYPIGYVNGSPKSRRHRERLREKGIRNINQLSNLVPACARCNSRKGKKTGIWILRGKLGSHPWFWPAAKAAAAMVILTLIVCCLLCL